MKKKENTIETKIDTERKQGVNGTKKPKGVKKIGKENEITRQKKKHIRRRDKENKMNGQTKQNKNQRKHKT